MHHVEKEHIPGLLLLIYFEKAFDSISWDFIHKSLDFLNFGPDIKSWVKLFQTNTKSAINQSGHFTSFVELQRGCRQGDTIFLFICNMCRIYSHMNKKQ